MDTIFLRELKVEMTVGVYPWEREAPQTIQLDLDIGLPHSRAGASDRVEDTIDYGRVVERVREDLASRPHNLVEAVAERVAQIVRDEFGAPWVRVAVTKLGLIRGVKHVGVAIERGARP